MNILVCNVGSTSLKYKLFDGAFQILAKGGAERVGQNSGVFYTISLPAGTRTEIQGCFPTHGEAIEAMLSALSASERKPEIHCVAFKVVHGGEVTGTQLLTDDVLQAMEAVNCIAPAHNPPYLAAIRQFRRSLPDTPLIGAFETAFHAHMPPEAYLYSIPIAMSRRYHLRRYGFHGASHEYLSAFGARKLQAPNTRIITCHLGGSGSICAVRDGVSLDTSMGLSLQCGIMHNNRCGDLDPYVIFYLAEELGMPLHEIQRILETESGFLGMSGISGDLRDVEEAAARGNEDAALAIRSYAYSIKKYIGAYTAVLGGLDAIVFGGGIGANSPTIRSLVLDGLEWLGIRPDPSKNRSGAEEITTPASAVRVFVTETDEELIVAKRAAALLNEKSVSTAP